MKESGLQWHRDPETGDIIFSGRFTRRDFERVRLDGAERRQLLEPMKGPADFLLDLELLFRRAGEQFPDPKAEWPKAPITARQIQHPDDPARYAIQLEDADGKPVAWCHPSVLDDLAKLKP